MSKFNLSATAECWRCGNYLSSSDDDCDACQHKDLRRYRFIHISEDRIQTVWAINKIRAWAALHEQPDVESVLPWKLRYSGMSLHYAQMGYDVTDPDELRTPNNP